MAVAYLKLEGFEELARAIDDKQFRAMATRKIRKKNMVLSQIGVSTLRDSIRKGWFYKNSPVTVTLKGSNKPLIDNADLYGNCGAKLVPWGFVCGTQKISPRGQVDVAVILHEGATIPVTDKMRNAWKYFAKITGGRVRPLKASTTHIKIPSRPFLRMAFIDDQTFGRTVIRGWKMALIETHIALSRKSKGASVKGSGKTRTVSGKARKVSGKARRKITPETRAKMRAAQQRRRARERAGK
jgi:hypothetical protein